MQVLRLRQSVPWFNVFITIAARLKRDMNWIFTWHLYGIFSQDQRCIHNSTVLQKSNHQLFSFSYFLWRVVCFVSRYSFLKIPDITKIALRTKGIVLSHWQLSSYRRRCNMRQTYTGKENGLNAISPKSICMRELHDRKHPWFPPWKTRNWTA